MIACLIVFLCELNYFGNNITDARYSKKILTKNQNNITKINNPNKMILFRFGNLIFNLRWTRKFKNSKTNEEYGSTNILPITI